MPKPRRMWRYEEDDAALGPTIEGADIRAVPEGPAVPPIELDQTKLEPLKDGGKLFKDVDVDL